MSLGSQGFCFTQFFAMAYGIEVSGSWLASVLDAVEVKVLSMQGDLQWNFENDLVEGNQL